MSGVMLPGVAIIEAPAPKPVSIENSPSAAVFAELLAVNAALIEPSLAAPVTTSSSDSDVVATDSGDSSEEYSPESWLEALALAITGVAAQTARDPGTSARDQYASELTRGDRSIALATAPRAATDATSAVTASASVGSGGVTPGLDTSIATGATGAVGAGVITAGLAALERVDPSEAAQLPESVRHWLEGTTPTNNALGTTRNVSSQHPHSLGQPVGTAAWQDELATKVVWLSRGVDHSATLVLNPADLGPVDVRISLRESEASVMFAAAHPETRATLEAALPRLRELFAGQGLVLADSTVTDHRGAFDHAAREQASRAPADLRRSLHAESERAATGSRTVVTRASLLDLYA